MTWGTECDVSSVSVCAIALRGTEYRLPEYDGGTELLPSARRSLDRVTVSCLHSVTVTSVTLFAVTLSPPLLPGSAAFCNHGRTLTRVRRAAQSGHVETKSRRVLRALCARSIATSTRPRAIDCRLVRTRTPRPGTCRSWPG